MQLDLLQYPPLRDDVLRTRALLEQDIEELKPFLKCSASDASALTAKSGRLAWAFEMCLSRIYTVNAPIETGGELQRCMILVPGLCLINHRTRSSIFFQYDETDQMFKIVSERSYAKGEQVFVSYGEKSNDNLLQWYGFSEEDNPVDTYRLPLLSRWLEENAAAGSVSVGGDTHAVNMERVESLGLSHGLLYAQLSLADSHLSTLRVHPSTMQALRAYLSDDDTIMAAYERSADYGSRDYQSLFKQALDVDSETHMLQTLLRHLRDTQTSMTGSIEQDTRRLQQVDLQYPEGSIEGIAIRFRREKRKVLEYACDDVQAALASL